MHLTILGCGSIGSEKNCSSYLVKTKSGYILMDIGPGAYSQLIREKIPQEKIHTILITHTHVDHVNDLSAFLWRAMFGIKRKVPLTIIGPKRFKKFFGKLQKIHLQIKEAKFQINIKELHNSKTSFSDGKITAKQTLHSKYSNAYRIDSEEKSITYSGDTDYCKNIIQISKSTDILILECSMPDDKKLSGHLSPELCGKIAHQSKAKSLVLVHLYPECEQIGEKYIIASVQKRYKGKVIKGEDSIKIKI